MTLYIGMSRNDGQVIADIRISMKRLFPAAPHMKAGQSMLLTQ